MDSIYALVDCNNFYASCERVFNPRLEGRPIVVLSNNDGCIIARSEEAKALGLKMAEPYFQARPTIEAHGVHVFSSNYPLYGDMSRRVIETLGEFAPEVEVYSIDEAYLNLSHMSGADLTQAGRELRAMVRRWTGIPVSVGIAATKTLAKVANLWAKRSAKAAGVLDLTAPAYVRRALQRTPIESVWGVGRNYARLLKDAGLATALDFRDHSEKWVERTMGLTGLRMQQELRGVACIGLDAEPPPRRGVSCTRSFVDPITDPAELANVIASFTTRAAEKLRRGGLVARTMIVFIGSNYYDDARHFDSLLVELPVPTCDTAELIDHATRALHRMARKGRRYKRAGVVMSELIPAGRTQTELFDDRDRDRSRALMEVLDGTNARMGSGMLRYAAVGSAGLWQTSQRLRSPRFTTSWDELAEVKA